MDVILLQDVDKVGLRGDVVSVARGYARNFLLPRKLAEVASPGRVAELQRRDAQRARHEARSVDQAREIAAVLEKTVLRFEVKAGPTGSLFGSVTATDVADELWRTRKVRVDRRKIGLDEPIKRVGRYEVAIDVFQDVRVEVKTLVVPEGGELPPEEEPSAEGETGADGEVGVEGDGTPAGAAASAEPAGGADTEPAAGAETEPAADAAGEARALEVVPDDPVA